MAKLSWDKFVAKYGKTGNLVTVGTVSGRFVRPNILSQKNMKKYPTVLGLLTESIGEHLVGDWAYTTESQKIRRLSNGKAKVLYVTIHEFVFSNPADAVLAGKLWSSGKTKVGPSENPNFASLLRGRELETREYARLVDILGY
ncbi:hypothetical protein SAMN04487972_12112 [Paracoccus halophilus]|uniref:Uncharacterized protein n=1 Tax=Paracoccus halophilus TaxID=376733 RepID=A0A099EZT4_9RHOB|nr:hypothetical protein [Paracoccus halophilus]KGJ03422.1 hypothetical protein IT41_14075 [Paracoccus halophilus]SFA58585.1 hypothetical protein SAMN04487972_12112 [Paracoccus halophilus]